MKYIKRRIEVEARQFTHQLKDHVFRWAKEFQMNIYPAWDEDNKPCIRIPTNEGEMTCKLGDWLIKEPFPTNDRKLYPCKPDIFEQTYEPAE